MRRTWTGYAGLGFIASAGWAARMMRSFVTIRRPSRIAAALLFVGTAGALIASSGCGSLNHDDSQVKDDPVDVQLAEEEPVPALVPGPEGTPLPPRNPRIAQRWPPEIREVVDKMLSLFQESPDHRGPSIQEVERKMGFTLKQQQSDTPRDKHQHFEISGSRFIDPTSKFRAVSGDYYRVSDDEGLKYQVHALQLLLAPRITGDRLDAYEMAVYTGAAFNNAYFSLHRATKQWDRAYVWGMFEWSETGDYSSPGLGLKLERKVGDSSGMMSYSNCISSMSVFAVYKRELK